MEPCVFFLAARNGKQLAVPANATRRFSLGFLPRLAVSGRHLRIKRKGSRS